MAARALVAIAQGDGLRVYINDPGLALKFLELIAMRKDVAMEEKKEKMKPPKKKDEKLTVMTDSAERCGGGVSVETPLGNMLVKPVIAPSELETDLEQVVTEAISVSAEARVANANDNVHVPKLMTQKKTVDITKVKDDPSKSRAEDTAKRKVYAKALAALAEFAKREADANITEVERSEMRDLRVWATSCEGRRAARMLASSSASAL